MLNGSMLTSHSQALSGLSAGTTYNYRVRSRDAAGNLATSGNYTFTTSAAPDTTPPNIANVASSGITSTGATLTWTTDEASDSQVEYGTSTSYGSTTTLNGSMLTSHSQALSGLSASTTYNYRVRSRDAAGNLATSGNYTFTTSAGLDTTPPNIANVASSGITATGATITWATNEAADSQVEYETSTSYGSSTMLNGSRVTSHSQTLTDLTANTTYHYRVKSRDVAGNLAISTNYVFTTSDPNDTGDLIISNIVSSAISTTQVAITWTTNLPASSEVEYGMTGSYGDSAVPTSSTRSARLTNSGDSPARSGNRRTATTSRLATSHSVTLSRLTPGTTYHYKVKSMDAESNLAASGDRTFATTIPDITAGLVAAYTFDEGQGSTIEDLSGSGNTASIYSADWTSGKYGNAVSFNGSNSYISAGTNRLPAINEPKTVSFWAKIPKKNSSTKTILALANSALETSLKQSLKNTQTGVVDAENRWNVVGKLPSIGAWHHFGYIFDGTHSHLYIDGIMAGRSMIALSAAPVTCFQIGRQADGSEYFEGSIDDLRIYARALTIEELAQAMNTPLAQSGAADVPAVAIVSEEIDLPIGSAYQPSEFPVVDLGLERRSYLQGDLVQTSALWISSPSTQSRDVELKMWIELPGLQPMPLRGLKVGDKLSLAPGYNHNFGIMPLLEISKEAPSGVCRVGARLIDPVSGTVLSESIQVFTIASEKNTRPKSHPAASESSRITIASYMENSRLYYVITNNGSSYAEIEAKLWFEFADGTVIQDFSIGAEGSLALAPKASITLTSSQIPEGAYKIKARLLNANTGALLAEAVQ
jgi:phosphodiesterase/alkaline phosphatase D-like protein